jgi:hypothetical protein
MHNRIHREWHLINHKCSSSRVRREHRRCNRKERRVRLNLLILRTYVELYPWSVFRVAKGGQKGFWKSFSSPQSAHTPSCLFEGTHAKKKRMKKNKNGMKKFDEKINRMKKEMVSNLSQTSRLSTSPLFLGVPVPDNVVYPSRLDPSLLPFSLSLHRHPYICTPFRSYFIY